MREELVNFVDEPEYRPNRRKRTAFLILLILALTFVTIACVSGKEDNDLPEDPLAYDPVTLEPKAPEGFLKKLSQVVIPGGGNLVKEDDSINILLLGMGGVGHDGPYLTDTIMIARIKPSTNHIALVSIPRDLAVEIPERGIQKINHTNAWGEENKPGWGAASATELIEKTFDIEIPYYIRIDFTAFEEIIDDMGGVSVNVDRSFTDNNFPAGGGNVTTIHFNAGTQTMNGTTALQYARSRYGNNGEGSDFARAARQQKILSALKDKALSYNTLTNPVRIKRMMDTLERHMTTNMEFSEILSLVRIMKDMDDAKTITLVLDNATSGLLYEHTDETAGYLLFPTAGNFKKINKAIEHIFDSEYDTLVNEARKGDTTRASGEPQGVLVEIQNGTWRAGLAARAKAEVKEDGFTIAELTNADGAIKPIAASGIYRVSKKSNVIDTIRSLQKQLKLPIKQAIPEGVQTNEDIDVLVVLGDDYTE